MGRYPGSCNAVLVALLFGVGLAVASGQESYRLGPEDVICIKVWDNPDLERTVSINRRGEFTFPLIGTVKASDLTAEELERALEEKLKDGYIVNPIVSVHIEEYHSKKIYVVGPVRKNGEFTIRREVTLLEVLAMTEGMLEDADEIVRIIHPRKTPEGEQELEGDIIEISVRKLMAGNMDYNVVLTHGDYVVFRYKSERRVFVLGEVKNPGPVPLAPDMRLMEAIAAAGGPSDPEATKVRVAKKPRSGPGVMSRDLEVMELDVPAVIAGKVGNEIELEDGDTIFIPEKNKKLFYVLGQVNKPGGYSWMAGLTVIKAITLGGGPTNIATTKGITISRLIGGDLKSFVAGVTDPVEPEDVIYVPEGWF